MKFDWPQQVKFPIVQVMLSCPSDTPQGRYLMTTWVNKTKTLKEGATISLKDRSPKLKWRVEKIYDGVFESTDFDWHRGWDNNI